MLRIKQNLQIANSAKRYLTKTPVLLNKKKPSDELEAPKSDETKPIRAYEKTVKAHENETGKTKEIHEHTKTEDKNHQFNKTVERKIFYPKDSTKSQETIVSTAKKVETKEERDKKITIKTEAHEKTFRENDKNETHVSKEEMVQKKFETTKTVEKPLQGNQMAPKAQTFTQTQGPRIYRENTNKNGQSRFIEGKHTSQLVKSQSTAINAQGQKVLVTSETVSQEEVMTRKEQIPTRMIANKPYSQGKFPPKRPFIPKSQNPITPMNLDPLDLAKELDDLELIPKSEDTSLDLDDDPIENETEDEKKTRLNKKRMEREKKLAERFEMIVQKHRPKPFKKKEDAPMTAEQARKRDFDEKRAKLKLRLARSKKGGKGKPGKRKTRRQDDHRDRPGDRANLRADQIPLHIKIWPRSNEAIKKMDENGVERVVKHEGPVAMNPQLEALENVKGALEFDRFNAFREILMQAQDDNLEARADLLRSVSEGKITQEHSDKIKHANPGVHFDDVFTPQELDAHDSIQQNLEQIGQDTEKFIAYLDSLKSKVIPQNQAREDLILFELNQYKENGSISDDIIDSYRLEIPYTELLSEIHFEAYLILQNQGGELPEVFNTLLDNYFVRRGYALTKFLNPEVDLEKRQDRWQDWITKEQREKLEIAMALDWDKMDKQGHIGNLLSTANEDDEVALQEVDPMEADIFKEEEGEQGDETTGYNRDQSIDERSVWNGKGSYLEFLYRKTTKAYQDRGDMAGQYENHVLVRFERYRYLIGKMQLDAKPRLAPHYIRDISRSDIAVRKFGNSGVLAPMDKYYARYLDLVPEGPAKQRLREQMHAVSKNKSWDTWSKVDFVRKMQHNFVKLNIPEKFNPSKVKHELYQKPTHLHSVKKISWVEDRNKFLEEFAENRLNKWIESHPDKYKEHLKTLDLAKREKAPVYDSELDF